MAIDPNLSDIKTKNLNFILCKFDLKRRANGEEGRALYALCSHYQDNGPGLRAPLICMANLYRLHMEQLGKIFYLFSDFIEIVDGKNIAFNTSSEMSLDSKDFDTKMIAFLTTELLNISGNENLPGVVSEQAQMHGFALKLDEMRKDLGAKVPYPQLPRLIDLMKLIDEKQKASDSASKIYEEAYIKLSQFTHFNDSILLWHCSTVTEQGSEARWDFGHGTSVAFKLFFERCLAMDNLIFKLIHHFMHLVYSAPDVIGWNPVAATAWQIDE